MSLEEISGILTQIQRKQAEVMQIQEIDFREHEMRIASLKQQLNEEGNDELEELRRQIDALNVEIEAEDIALAYVHGECMEYTDKLYALEQQIASKEMQKVELDKMIQSEYVEMQEQINKVLLRNVEKKHKLSELKLQRLERNRGRNFVPASWLMDN